MVLGTHIWASYCPLDGLNQWRPDLASLCASRPDALPELCRTPVSWEALKPGNLLELSIVRRVEVRPVVLFNRIQTHFL